MKSILLGLAATCICIALIFGAQPARGMPLSSGTPLNLSSTPDDSRNPAIAAGTGGSRHVVWEERVVYSPTLSLKQLWHKASNGVSWTTAISVGTGIQPALAVGPDNRAQLVWADTFSGTSQIFYSQWNGSSWAVPKLIAPGLSGDATAPTVAVNSNNTVYASWGQFNGGSYSLYLASSAAGGAGPWTALPVPNAVGDAPTLVMAPGGAVHLAWQRAATSAHAIYYAVLNGNTWSLPENISQAPGIDSLNPSIALATNGRPLVVWSGAAGGQYEVWSSLRGPSGWSTPINVSNSPDDSMRPHVVRSGSDLLVLWDESTTPGTIDWAFGANGGWSAAKTLVSGGGDWGAVAPAAAPDGTVHYAFDGGLALNGDVFYDSLALAHLFLPLVRR